MKPTSLEKRDMIVSARERGETVKGIATLLKVSRATAYNIWNLHKATNSIAPKPYPGKESSLTDEQLDAIRQAAMEESDITLAELIEKLGLPTRKSQLSRVLISMR
jgi:transposase